MRLTVDLIFHYDQPGSKGEVSSATRFPLRSKGDLPLRSMRSSIEPIRWIHKPLSLYFVLQSECATYLRFAFLSNHPTLQRDLLFHVKYY